MEKKLMKLFMKKSYKKQIRKNLEKIIKKKGDKQCVKWKSFNSFNSWIDKKDIASYFPEPHTDENKIEVELELSNYPV